MTCFASCGEKQIGIDIVLSSNDTTNQLKKISLDMQTGNSAGIYFILDELKSLPVSISDLVANGSQISDPSASGVGNDPLQGAFSISTSSLNPNSFFRVRMIAKDVSGNITHVGTSDCPLKVSLGDQNKVKICFGVNDTSNPPLCAGLTRFTDCPGL